MSAATDYAALTSVPWRWNTHRDSALVQNNVLHVHNSFFSRSTDTSVNESVTTEDKISEIQGELMKEQLQYQQRIFKLEKENQEIRRQIMLRQEGRDIKSRKLKRNPIEMYSEILDDLVDLYSTFGTHVALPQVVLVGDGNSGKSSLLEMLLRTRIFPRSDYKPQVPVKFTMCEGPYHLAQFNDTEREFDMENSSDIEELRKELELRLKSAAAPDSNCPLVSLTIWGPGLSRMVIVDLPAAPSSTGTESTSISEKVREMCQTLLQSSHTLLLCTIDASRDSDYSRTVELVKDFDPDGRRSVFVLTKVDLAETSLADPDKIRRITDGSIFPLKAAGYFVALPGRGLDCRNPYDRAFGYMRIAGPKNEPLENVEAFERQYFSESSLFKSGLFKPNQLSTKQLAQGVAETFWLSIKHSLRYQIDFFKARKAALEKDWKAKFHKARVLDRDELYETGRMQLLDDVARLGSVQSSQWESDFEENLWTGMSDYIFDHIYIPIAMGNRMDAKVTSELKLKNWADVLLPLKSIEVAHNTLHEKFKTIAGRSKGGKEHDEIYDSFKLTIVDEAFRHHHWDVRARENLRSALMNVCEAPYVITPDDWNTAVRFMEQACADRLTAVQAKISELLGPSTMERWFLLRTQTPEHKSRRAVVDQLEKLVMPHEGDLVHGPEISKDEVNVILKTLESEDIKVEVPFIRETWRYLFLSRFLEQAIQKIALCGDVSDSDKADTRPHKGDCSDVDLFYRIKRMIRTASVALRQQLTTTELGRLEAEVKQILDGLERDPVRIKQYFNHARIGLAEELKKITTIQEKLEDLQKLLEEEEPNYVRSSGTGDEGA